MDGDVITRNVAKILADRQIKLGLSLRQIEEKSGVTRMSASRILSGESAMPLDKFEAVARALDLVPWQVMRDAEVAVAGLEVVDCDAAGSSGETECPDSDLPDIDRLAVRRVTSRPSWDESKAGEDAGEEPTRLHQTRRTQSHQPPRMGRNSNA